MKRIVLVEDDPDDVYLFKSSMSEVNCGFELTVVNDGQEILDFFESGQHESDDELLVLLDLNLPKITGLDVLRKLKEQNEVNNKIIIVFSTSQHQQDIDDAYDLGAKSYFVKIPDPKGLRKVVNSLSRYWFEMAEFPKDEKK